MFLSNGEVIPNSLQRTLGDLTPAFHDMHYYGTNSGALLSGIWAEYGAIYTKQLWVGIVVRKRAYATARMPLEILRPGRKGVMALEAGPMQALMDAPNRRMSPFQLWQWTSSTRDIYGEAFWAKWRDDRGQVRELQPIHPRNIVIRRNAETGELEYVYTAGKGFVLPEEDVVAFTAYNPDNLLRGTSNLESLRMTLLNEDAARRATSQFWQNGARPSIILTHPNELSKGAQDRLAQKAQENMGGVNNVGKVSVFEEGITPHIVPLNAEEMQYIDSRKLNREEVCAAFDMSPIVVHILDHATFSNVTEQLRSQYRDTMAPIFTEYQSVIDTQLAPDFYDDGAKSRFNMDDVLRGDIEKRTTTAQALRQSGIFTGNEARVFVGADPSDDPLMDEVFANSALQRLGQTKAPAAGPATAGPGAAAEATEDAGAPALESARGARTKFLGRPALRSIMGKIPAALAKAGTPTEIYDVMEKAHRDALYDYYGALHDDIRAGLESKAAGDLFDRNVWDSNLKAVLSALARKTAEAAGEAQAAALGSTFDFKMVEDWLDINCELGAEMFNESTADTLAEMLSADFADEAAKLAALDETFDEGGLIHARAGEQAVTRTTTVSQFAGHDAAKRADGKVTKTWHVNSKNPRKSHAQVSGDTVGVEETFSNGMQYPGDFAGGFDEVANCKCTTSYSKED